MSAGKGVIHTGDKSGGELMVCVVTVVQHTSGKFGCKLVTLFGSDCGYGLSAVVIVGAKKYAINVKGFNFQRLDLQGRGEYLQPK